MLNKTCFFLSILIIGLSFQACNNRTYPLIFCSRTIQDTLECHLDKIRSYENKSGKPIITLVTLHRYNGMDKLVLSSGCYVNRPLCLCDTVETIKQICAWKISESFVEVFSTKELLKYVHRRHKLNNREKKELDDPELYRSDFIPHWTTIDREYIIVSPDSLLLESCDTFTVFY